jgi:hypothetical protein
LMALDDVVTSLMISLVHERYIWHTTYKSLDHCELDI